MEEPINKKYKPDEGGAVDVAPEPGEESNPLFLVSIEPVYSQGVGGYYMISSNIENIQKFRNQLVEMREYIVKNEPEEIESWYFVENVFRINSIDEENESMNGVELCHNKYEAESSIQLEDIDFSDAISLDVEDMSSKDLKEGDTTTVATVIPEEVSTKAEEPDRSPKTESKLIVDDFDFDDINVTGVETDMVYNNVTGADPLPFKQFSLVTTSFELC